MKSIIHSKYFADDDIRSRTKEPEKILRMTNRVKMKMMKTKRIVEFI